MMVGGGLVFCLKLRHAQTLVEAELCNIFCDLPLCGLPHVDWYSVLLFCWCNQRGYSSCRQVAFTAWHTPHPPAWPASESTHCRLLWPRCCTVNESSARTGLFAVLLCTLVQLTVLHYCQPTTEASYFSTVLFWTFRWKWQTYLRNVWWEIWIITISFRSRGTFWQLLVRMMKSLEGVGAARTADRTLMASVRDHSV